MKRNHGTKRKVYFADTGIIVIVIINFITLVSTSLNITGVRKINARPKNTHYDPQPPFPQ